MGFPGLRRRPSLKINRIIAILTIVVFFFYTPFYTNPHLKQTAKDYYNAKIGPHLKPSVIQDLFHSAYHSDSPHPQIILPPPELPRSESDIEGRPWLAFER